MGLKDPKYKPILFFISNIESQFHKDTNHPLKFWYAKTNLYFYNNQKMTIMKTIVCTILFSTFLFSNSLSQTYYPFPESDAIWKYNRQDIPDYCPCMGTCSIYQYIITGDSTINNFIYHKIKQSGFYYVDNCDTLYFDQGYQGAYRNDFENKKVLFVPAGELNEKLLYDFNLNIGDTIPVSYLNPGYDCFVNEIDSVLVGNSYRKRIMFNCDWNYGDDFSMIEGIGGMELIEPFDQWFSFEAGSSFTCINIGDTLFYPGGESCDEIIVNINQASRGKDFKINPNPSSGLFWIKSTIENSQSLSIEVYNCYGEKVKQFYSAEIITMLDLSILPKGIYLLHCTSEEYVFKEKIIIQ